MVRWLWTGLLVPDWLVVDQVVGWLWTGLLVPDWLVVDQVVGWLVVDWSAGSRLVGCRQFA